MTDAELLTMVKADLQLLTSAFDTYLAQLIDVAKAEIEREGITLSLSEVSDCHTVVMYTSWLYRKRASDDTSMPKMLRQRLNNRLFQEKVSGHA